MKIPDWIKNAYKGTDVHWSRSQQEIYKMLNQLGINDVRFTNLKDRFCLEFMVKIKDDEKPRAVRIISVMDDTDDENVRTKQLNITHRMLVAHIYESTT